MLSIKIERGSSDCGGVATPYSGSSIQTWDLSTGKQVNTNAWIENADQNFNGKLKQLLLRLSPYKIVLGPASSDETEKIKDPCEDEFINTRKWDVFPGKNGLIFMSVVEWCHSTCGSVRTEVPYRMVMRFLNEDGRRAVKSIQ